MCPNAEEKFKFKVWNSELVCNTTNSASHVKVVTWVINVDVKY